MAIGATEISTAGVRVHYAVEATAGTRPTTGYAHIAEIVEIPDMSQVPETIQTTPLEETKNHRYIFGLRDSGGSISMTANFSEPKLKEWNNTIVPAYKTAAQSGKSMWFCVTIPGFEDAFYFEGIPTEIGMPGASVGSAYQVALPIAPTGDQDWYPVPTDFNEEV